MKRNFLIILLLLCATLLQAQTVQDSVKTQPLSQYDSVDVANDIVFPIQFVRNDSSLWGKFSVRALYDYFQRFKLPKTVPFSGQAPTYQAGQDSLEWRSFLLYSDFTSHLDSAFQTLSRDGDSIAISDGNKVYAPVSASSQVTPPSYVAFDDTLTFAGDKYYQPYTQTDTLNLFADTTNSEYGKWTVARVTANGDPINFIGNNWDTLQRYNITDGEALDSAEQYMFYFERQPYGITVNVPQNQTTSTIVGGGGQVGETIGNLVYEIDGADSTMFSTPSDSITRIDMNPTANALSYENTTSANEPQYDAVNKRITFGLPDVMNLSTATQLNSGAFTVVFAMEHNTSGDEQLLMWGGSGLWQSRNGNALMTFQGNSSVNITYFKSTGVKTLYIMTFDNGTVDLYVNDMATAVGSGSTGATSVTINSLSSGDASKSIQSHIYYHSIFSKVLSEEERESIKTYVNNTFAFQL